MTRRPRRNHSPAFKAKVGIGEILNIGPDLQIEIQP